MTGELHTYNIKIDCIKLNCSFDSLGNAAGRKTPPLLIFSGKRLPNQINTILPFGWFADISESGWMNTEVFYNYVANSFYPWLLQNNIIPPVVLFVDGHVSHRSLKLSEFCYEKNIILVCLLPNTTHLCQPMDVIVFGSVKREWCSTLQTFKITSRGEERMTKATFCDLLNKCLDGKLTVDILKSAFSKTALYPFGAEHFDFSCLPVKQSAHSESVRNNMCSPQTGWSQGAFAQLEQMIEFKFPNRLAEFKDSFGEWTGAIEAKDLFDLWQAVRSHDDCEQHEMDIPVEILNVDIDGSQYHLAQDLADSGEENLEMFDVIYQSDEG